ncbi:MAG: tetratricopeptide repeat protein [Rhodospirillaceae bacterium]|nr:tetratricopeptide repeat protein [Rhodospirillaceae bacterium]
MNLSDTPLSEVEIRAALREALAHHRAGQLQDAVDIYRGVQAQIPDNPEILVSLGAALLGLELAAEAIEPLERALSVRPGHASTCFTLAEAYRREARIEDAYEAAKIGLIKNPDYFEGRMAMADALLDMGRYDEAEDTFQQLLADHPDNPVVRGKLGCLKYYVGEFEAAEADISSALRDIPDDMELNWHLACLYLLQRRWSEGWNAYSWRWPMAKRVAPEKLAALPIWNGAGLTGKSIVVWAEQGLGDELMFATCLPDLLERAAPRKCILACDQRIESLLKRSYSGLETLPITKVGKDFSEARVPDCDFQISAGDLPRFFRRYTADFPSEIRPLVPDTAKVEKWRARLAALGDGLKVGIAWRGGTNERFKRSKSSTLEDWRGIFSIPGVSFVNLQYGDCAPGISDIEKMFGVGIHDWDDLDPIADPEDQMAQISCLDLVIQTSNASAHMAGAMNIPVWNMVPYVPDSRWSLEGDACLWYPSMRMFRQPTLHDWNSLFAQVEAELRILAKAQKG